MSTGLAISVFVASLVLSIVSSNVLADLLDKTANRYRFPEGVVGLITALGADSPEIAAAVTAISSGSGTLGVGIVLGSNLYNLAALLGLSAVIAGTVSIRRRAVLLQGGVALVVTAIGTGLVVHLIAPVLSFVVVLLVMSAYVGLSSLSSDRLRALFPVGALRQFLLDVLEDQKRDVRTGTTPPAATRADLMALVPVLTSVVLASIGLVTSARTIGARYGVSDVITGTLVLAILTGIPNLLAALRLARRHRGSAVVSEALNSNSINVAAGLCLPAVIVGRSGSGYTPVLESIWLLAVTALAVALMFFRGGLIRWEGFAVIAAYAAFVLVLVLTLVI